MITTSELAYLTSLIMSAAIDHKRWESVMEELHRLSGGVRPFLIGHDQETGYVLNAMGTGYDESYVKSFEQYYGTVNPWAEGFFNAKPNSYLSSDEMCDRYVVERSEFYNDWIRPQEDIVGGGGILLFKQQERVFALGGQIRRADIDVLDNRWRQIIELVTPHLKQAFEINRQLAGKCLENWVMSSSPANQRFAIALINGAGRLVYWCELADQLLAERNILHVGLDGKLRFPAGKAQNMLVKALRSLNTCGIAAPGSATIESSGDGAVYTARLGAINPDQFSDAPLALFCGMNEPLLLLTLSTRKESQNVAPLLIRQYGLTGSEARIVLSMADGADLRMIAEMRKVSIHTIRNQIKSSMAKMEVSRQVDLVLKVEQLKQSVFF